MLRLTSGDARHRDARLSLIVIGIMAIMFEAGPDSIGCAVYADDAGMHDLHGEATALNDVYGGCCPQWTARAGAVALLRSRPDRYEIVSDAVTLGTLIDSRSFEFGYEPGFDVSLVRHGPGSSDLEVRYLQSDAWNPRGFAGSPNVPVINFETPTFVGAAGPTAITGLYDSDLLSGELNLRRYLGMDLTGFVGARYLEIDEHLGFTFSDPGLVAPTQMDVVTRNRLYGGQIGVELIRPWREQWDIGFALRGGVFGNAGAQFTALDTGALTITAAGASSSTPLLGEAAATLTYHVRPQLSFRATYSILAVSDLALASDQVGFTNMVAGTGFVDTGGVYYHGGLLGLEYRQ